ncbi:hypothetical protein QVD99_005428 [Batrachochytrium dendrobatidis]|nr:hypothetical protein O5D80_004236 [Batrachochytrium dendrobatidis]KAK5668408.1 hypothetical protein QVD99_005428 [Batrachochytrium dendrobatidis]
MVFGRRSVKLLPALSRLKRFGNYNLILPTQKVLLGDTMIKSTLKVPSSIPQPEYDVTTGKPLVVLDHIHVNSESEIKGMYASGKLARQVLDLAVAMVKPGVTTLEIDAVVHQSIINAGAYPSPLGYLNFPRSVCTSINNVLCHGVPDDRPLEDGDIINIDVTVYLNGFHGDTSRTVCVGDVDQAGQALVNATKESLDSAIAVCGPGVPFSAIGSVVSKFARSGGYSISRDFCGHGIGRQFHQPPYVLHYKNNEPWIMQPGMTFTIEPVLCQGDNGYAKWPDAWTVVSLDGGRSAQFEHTVLIVDDGVKILT